MYGFDLADWYRGKVTARWLWVRLSRLPLSSPLAEARIDAAEQPDAVAEWPPKRLDAIPVAKSMAAVGRMVAGADLN